jgi:hypothetical protein
MPYLSLNNFQLFNHIGALERFRNVFGTDHHMGENSLVVATQCFEDRLAALEFSTCRVRKFRRSDVVTIVTILSKCRSAVNSTTTSKGGEVVDNGMLIWEWSTS